jgi:hypothetical protein
MPSDSELNAKGRYLTTQSFSFCIQVPVIPKVATLIIININANAVGVIFNNSTSNISPYYLILSRAPL